MITKVYVAGASKELARAQVAMSTLEGMGITVTSSWIKEIAKAGAPNPADATLAQYKQWTLRDLAEVYDANVLLLLLPAKGIDTVGAWIELGFAVANDRPIIMSGPHRPIFTPALATEHFMDDGEAIRFIAEHHQAGVQRVIDQPMRLSLSGMRYTAPLGTLGYPKQDR